MRESVSAGCSQLMDDILCEDGLLWMVVQLYPICCVLELYQQLLSALVQYRVQSAYAFRKLYYSLVFISYVDGMKF